MSAVAEPEAQAEKKPEPDFVFHDIALALVEPAKRTPPDLAEDDQKAWETAERKERKDALQVRGVDLKSFEPKDRSLIFDFLNSHLARVWRLREGGRTRSANFRRGSLVAACYGRMTSAKPAKFLEESRKIAERLIEVTPWQASRGLLMILHFRHAGTPHLGLFKFDPGAHDSIYLKEGTAGQMLLELAASRVAYELPEPGDRVLKWAVTPHPAGADFQIKLRDEQQRDVEPAYYFVEFLECQDFENEGRLAARFVAQVLEHAKDERRLQAARTGVSRVAGQAGSSAARVDLPTLVQWVQKAGLVKDGELASFENRLRQAGVDRLQAPPNVFNNLQLSYVLSTGITISGSLSDILNQVQIKRVGPVYEFSLAVANYSVSVT